MISQQEDLSEPIAAAKAAGLRYVTDARPGIRRERRGDKFVYMGVDGQPLEDQTVLSRIKALAIPPAWTDVWISPLANGHIQATGRDARGRKQYRYHPNWRAFRDETKYHRMVAFGAILPRIRLRLRHDLALPGLPREKILATVVQLLDATAVRVGNDEYVRENGTYGLTTLETDHVHVDGTTLHVHFRGKSGKEHSVTLRDRRLARIIKRLQDLPGQELFHYVDDDGELRSIDSHDVNEYLREISGEEITAKAFRTWHGTVVATTALKDIGPAQSEAQARHNVAEAIRVAAEFLGNTPAICRKSYIHPDIIAAYLNAEFFAVLNVGPVDVAAGLRQAECEVLAILNYSPTIRVNTASVA